MFSKNLIVEEGWKEILEEEFRKDYFLDLARKVKAEYSRPDATVYPPVSQIFNAFNACAFSETKVVIIGQDPYHNPGQAHGLAFSVNPDVSIPPSLQNIFKEIKVETGTEIPSNGNLNRWARQGVLLLNSSLSVLANRPGSHKNLGWARFTDAVVNLLCKNRKNLVFMLWGNDAIKKGKNINRSEHLVLHAPHPSPLSAYSGFFGCNHFVDANNYLISNNKTPIIW